MRQLLKLTTLFFILGIVNFRASAQSMQVNGVVKEEIKLKEGKIMVYLPDDIRAGDVISMLAVAEPSGRNEKEKNRNLESLQKYKLKITGTVVPLSGLPRQIIITGKIPSKTDLILLEEKGAAIFVKPIVLNTSLAQPGSFSNPTHALTEAPFRITGPFDGDASNTRCSLDGKAIEVLAESPRQVVCNMPQTTSGSHTLTIIENGQTIEKNISAVNMNLSTGKLNLLKGEKTFVDVAISGLQNLPSNATLTVTNTTTNTVTMMGGETQVISIPPSGVNEAGFFNKKFDLQSVKTGSFSLNVNLDLPEPETKTTATSHPAALCNCYINEQSYLLPLQICLALGGSQNLPEINSNQPGQPVTDLNNPPIVSFTQPGSMNEQTGVITLQLSAPANNIAAVIFSERAVSDTQWTHIGNAVNNGTTWQFNWTTPIGRDGEHIIRARVAGKNNVITEKFTQTNIQRTSYTINPTQGENISLSISENDIRNADQKTKNIDNDLRKLQEKLDALQKQLEELQQKQADNSAMAGELTTIDQTIDKIPGIYRDSLKKLTDSLDNLKKKLPAKVDPAALQKAADDAAQRLKDCEERLNKLKQDRDKAKQDLDDLNKKIDGLLNQMDQLHLGNDWIGGHGYHADGRFWYGYVGDERSNTNIDAASNAIASQLRGLRGPQKKANDRYSSLNAAVAAAQADCDKLKKEKEKADEAAKNGNQHAATETQIDELCRQIADLMAALKKWCAAHPVICNFDTDLPANPGTPAELQAYLDKLDEIIKKKQQKEKDLENEAAENASGAQSTEDKITEGQADKNKLEGDKAKAQEEADKLRKEREKQLEAERAERQKKIDEENARRNKPKPEPILSEPVNPSNDQIKFQSIGWVLRPLIYEYKYSKGQPCDCITKALICANNTNSAAQDLVGRIGVGVAFAPLEAFPGFSFGVRLGIGVAKSLGNALFGGQPISNELAKNLFNVIGGEIFPKLLGDEFAGNRLNDLASGGLDAVLKDEGVRAFNWEGETEITCGNKTSKIKSKTTMLFNPNTGWVTMMIKIENCPLIVVKYKVNKDGIPITKPIVKKVTG